MRYVKLSMLIIFISFISPIIFTHKTFASISSSFPNGTMTNGNSLDAIVARDQYAGSGDQVTVDAPKAQFEVTTDITSSSVDVRIENACKDPSSHYAGYYSIEFSAQGIPKGDPGSSSNPRTNGGGDGGSCTPGGDLLINNIAMGGVESRYNNERKAVTITVRKAPGTYGIKFFKVVVSGANNPKVSFSGDTEYDQKKVPSTDPDAFAVWGYNGGSSSDISFTFKPDCKYKAGTPVWFKWNDADDGASNQGSGLYFTISDTTPQWKLDQLGHSRGSTLTKNSLGGQGDNSDEWVSKVLRINHQYTWTWHNVSENNGVQLWIPFSENTQSIGNCSVEDCTTNASLPGCPVKSACTELTVHDQGDYDPFTDTNGDGADDHNVSYETRTVVKIVDSAGKVFYDGFANPSGPGMLDDTSSDKSPQKTYGPYTPTGKDIVITISRQYKNNSGNWVEYSTNGTQTHTCYQADCTGLSVTGSLPGAGSVIGGQSFEVHARIKNTGTPEMLNMPASLGGNLLSVTSQPTDFWSPDKQPNGWIPTPMYQSIDVGETVDFDFTLWAPDDIAGRTLTVYPDYYGRFAVGGGCSVVVNTYKEYNVNPIATINNADNENPTLIDYTTGGSMGSPNPGIGVILPTSSSVFVASDADCNNVLRVVRNNNDGSPTYGSVPLSHTEAGLGRPAIAPGEFYCISTTIPSGHGWVGPPVNGGASSNVITINATTNKIGNRVVNKPYVRFYGQDVFAGGNFDLPGESRIPGGISTNYRPAGIGSGVEYAAFALGVITNAGDKGFATSSLRTDGLFDLLNFASGPPRGNFGGDHIATNYFKVPDNTELITNGAGQVNLNSLQTKKTYYYKTAPGEVFALRNPPESFSGSTTVYIEGDVVVTNNIKYSNWGADINAIPSFRLIVKGNIFIASNVTQIDGLLVAEPTTGLNGKITTCTKSDGTDASLVSDGTTGECSKQLVINGALVAQRIKWLRTFKTLSSVTTANGREPYNNSSAAEVINTSPDFYLGTPADPPIGGCGGCKYDSYQALPPIL